MAVSRSFIERVIELSQPLGRITVRRMFGGAGVYADGLMFALLHDDIAYLKVDPQTRPAFEAEACGALHYATPTGVQVLASFHRLPDHLLDDPDLFLDWVREALAAARRLKHRAAGPVTCRPPAAPSAGAKRRSRSKP